MQDAERDGPELPRTYEEFAEFDADAAKKHLRPVARQPLEVVRDKLAAISVWTAENVHHAIQATADELEVGMGKVGMPLRVAVTGAGQLPAPDVTVPCTVNLCRRSYQ